MTNPNPNQVREEYRQYFQTLELQDIDVEDNFVIDNMDKAAWVMTKLKACEDALRLISGRYQVQAKAINDAHQEAMMQLAERQGEEMQQYKYVIDSLWARFGVQILAIIKQELVTARKKSLNISGAVIGFKKERKKFEVVDAEAATDWALANFPEAVTVDVSRGALETFRKTHNGVNIPGTREVAGADKFYCKVGEISLELPSEETTNEPGNTEDNPVQQGEGSDVLPSPLPDAAPELQTDVEAGTEQPA